MFLQLESFLCSSIPFLLNIASENIDNHKRENDFEYDVIIIIY